MLIFGIAAAQSALWLSRSWYEKAMGWALITACRVLPWKMLPLSWYKYRGVPSLYVDGESLAKSIKSMFGTKVVAVNFDFQSTCSAVHTLWPHRQEVSNFVWTTGAAAKAAMELCEERDIMWIVHDKQAVLKLIEKGTPFLVVTHNASTNCFKSVEKAAMFLQNALGSRHFLTIFSGQDSDHTLREQQLQAFIKLADVDQEHSDEIRAMLGRPELGENCIPGLLLDECNLNLSHNLRAAHTFYNGATWTVLSSPTMDDIASILPRSYRSSAGSSFFIMYFGPSSPDGAPLLHGQAMSVTDMLLCLADSRARSLPDVIMVLASARAIIQAVRVSETVGPDRDPRWVLRNNLDNILTSRHPYSTSWNAVLSSDDSRFNLTANQHFQSPSKSLKVQELQPQQHAQNTTRALTILFLLYCRVGWHIMWKEPDAKPRGQALLERERRFVKLKQTVPLFLWPLGLSDADPVEDILA